MSTVRRVDLRRPRGGHAGQRRACRLVSGVDALPARIADEHDRLGELSDHIRRNVTGSQHAAARVDFEQLLVVLGPQVTNEMALPFPMLLRTTSDDVAGHHRGTTRTLLAAGPRHQEAVVHAGMHDYMLAG